MATLEEVIEAKDELSLRLLPPQARWRAQAKPRSRPSRKDAARNLHGVGVGYKVVGGKITRTLCVRLYVEQKIAASAILRATRLPKRFAGIPTDVIESPVPVFHPALCTKVRRQRVVPLVGGVSAAHRDLAWATTFGCFCTSLKEGEDGLFMLGTNHGFANMNAGRRGDPIYQPSPTDGSGAMVGRLARAVPLLFGGTAVNRVDAAVAQVLPGIKLLNEICTVGKLRGVTNAALDMKVKKHGRTTGYTEGFIADPSLDSYVFPYPDGQAALFNNQCRTEVIPGMGYRAPPDESAYDGMFVAPGDSGSVIVEKSSNRAVGLHFAGGYGISVSSPMALVCAALQISIP